MNRSGGEHNQAVERLSVEQRRLLARQLLSKGKRQAGQPRVSAVRRLERGRDEGYPLSYAQEQIWYLEQLEPGSFAYNSTWSCMLQGQLISSHVEASLNEVIKRHEVLRTLYMESQGRPVQQIMPFRWLRLRRVDARGRDETEQSAILNELYQEEVRNPISLDTAPLLRATLVELSSTAHCLILTVHHIAGDGASFGLLMNELSQVYLMLSTGQAYSLPELPIQYADYASWQRESLDGGLLQKELNYWKERLSGAVALTELPLDYPRPGMLSSQGDKVRFRIEGELFKKLKQLSQQHNVTLYMLLLSVFGLLLNRYTSQEDIVIGCPVASRTIPETQSLIGCFLNNVALRLDLSGNPSFASLLQRVRKRCLEAFAHQNVPFDKVIEALKPERSPSYTPIFQTLFEVQTAGSGNNQLGEAAVTFMEVDSKTSKYDLTVSMVDIAEAIVGYMEYRTDLFHADTMTLLAERYERLLEQIVEQPMWTLSEFKLLRAQEYRMIVQQWNDTARSYTYQSLHHRFEEQAARTPDRLALIYASQQLTYAQLNGRANRLARAIIAQGGRPGSHIGLSMQRSMDMVVSILAILKAGSCYVPLEPEYPKERLRHIVTDAAIEMILTHQDMDALFEDLPVLTLHVERWCAAASEEDAVNLDLPCSESDLAYILYTSGSTGKPKGVMIEQRGIVNRLAWMQDEFPLSVDDRILHKTPYTFDVSVWEFFWPLCYGSTLVVAKPEGHLDPAYLADVIEAEKITIIHFVPSMLQIFLQSNGGHRCGSLTRIFCSGEALNPQLRQACLTQLNCRLYNLYGPTEASIDVTWEECRPGDEAAVVTIGKPISNMQVYILDEQMCVLPIGVPGELFIGGVGLARGYVNLEELTREKFISHSFDGIHAVRLYRSGDVARYLSDGTIEYRGRMDHQVKLNGLRIELGEIEHVLRSHPEVQEGVVLAVPDEQGRTALTAYMMTTGDVKLTTASLREWFSQYVPDYMVPRFFITVREFPLTSSGKVDRKALLTFRARSEPSLEPALDAEATTRTEKLLLTIWQEVLGISRLGVHDNFFELGGDSIMSIQIISRARELGVHATPRDIFKHQTIARLAAAADLHRSVAIDQGPATGLVPLAPIQRWFFDAQFADQHHWNQALLFEVSPLFTTEMLRQAIHQVVEHHDMLRCRYALKEGGWTQYIVPVEHQEIYQSRLLDAEDERSEREIIVHYANECQASLDLLQGPIIRCIEFKRKRVEASLLFIAIHHLVVDAVSWRIILEDVTLACRQLAAGRQIQLPLKTTSYQEWSNKLTEVARQAAREPLTYWLAQPQQYESGAMPMDDRQGNAVEATSTALSLSLSATQTSRLTNEVPLLSKTTSFELLLAALEVALHRWCGAAPITVDIEGHGREEAIIGEVDLSRTVGWFTTIYPVTLNELGGAELRTVIAHVKRKLRAVPASGIGYGIMTYLSGSSAGSDSRVRPLLFNYLGRTDAAVAAGNEITRLQGYEGQYRSPNAHMPYWIALDAQIAERELHVYATFSNRKFRPETIRQFLDIYEAAIVELIDACTDSGADYFIAEDFPQAMLQPDEFELVYRSAGGSERRGEIENIYRLTPMQQGLLFHTLLSDNKALYFQQFSCKLTGHLNINAFRQAWQTVMDRHAVLRTMFLWEGLNEPRQVVFRKAEVQLHVEDLRGEASSGTVQQLRERYVRADAEQGFDLACAPLMRLTLLRVQTEEYLFIWSYHHLILDGWSQAQLMDEVFRCYAAFEASEEVIPSSRGAQFHDYIEWLQQQDITVARHFWTDSLRGFQTPSSIRSYTNLDSMTEGTTTTRTVVLSTELTAAVQEFSRTAQITLSTVFQGVWAIILSRWAGTSDVVFGVTVSGRPAELHGIDHSLGLFINTLPMRVQLQGDRAILPWLQELQQQQLELRQYEYTPLAQIQGWSELPQGIALFDSIIVFENYPAAASIEDVGLSLTIQEPQMQEMTNYPITLTVQPGSSITVELAYDSHQLSALLAERIAHSLEAVLSRLAADGTAKLSELCRHTPEEQAALVLDLNKRCRSDRLIPQKLLHHLFEDVAGEQPNGIAMISGNRQITYGELNAHANRLGHGLRRRGVGPETIIGVYMERSIACVTAILAILKAGGAYLPLDPAYPPERIGYMIEDAKPLLVITQSVYERPPVAGISEELWLNMDKEAFLAERSDNVQANVQPHHLCYVIYTSGTTGRPKGVMIEHRNWLSVACSWQTEYRLQERKVRLLQIASLSFDVCAGDLARMIMGAGTMIICPDDARMNLPELYRLLRDEKVTLFESTPALVLPLMEYIHRHQLQLPDLSLLIVGSDTLTLQDYRLLVERVGPGCAIVNSYGVTEAAIDSCCFWGGHDRDVPQYRSGHVPIGQPLSNTRLYLLNADGAPVDAGIQGELYIGGDGVGRGYLNKPELTGDRFLPDPFLPGGSMYRTGDYARWTDEGVIEFIGRDDGQLKISGIRVELGELETVLAAQSGVQSAAVVAIGGQMSKYLCACYVGPAEREALVMQMSRSLPPALVPSRFVRMSELPLTFNGKIDRKQLEQHLLRELPEPAASERPQDELEAQLLAIWSKVLGVEVTSIHHSFFELGGNSILLLRLYNEINEQLQVELTIADLFAQHTVRMLAHWIRSRWAAPGDKQDRLEHIMDELAAGDIGWEQAQERIDALGHGGRMIF